MTRPPVFGQTWQEPIQEDFGDGIMSAIDIDFTMEQPPDPCGDRVEITMSGKFLPYMHDDATGNIPACGCREE